MIVLAGVHHTDDGSPSALLADYPNAKCERLFISGVLSPQDLRTKFSNLCTPYWNAGIIPVVSFKPNTSAVINGSWNTRLRELAVYLSTKPTTWVIVWHEPENDMSGTTFKSMFNKARSEMKIGWSGIKVGYSAMAYHWAGDINNPTQAASFANVKNPADWMPTADFYGADVYSGDNFTAYPNFPNTITRDHTGFKRWKANIPAGAEWGLTERGWKNSTDSERQAIIRNETEWLKTTAASDPKFSHYIHWASDGTENNPDLIPGPLARVAINEMLDYFDNPTPPPTGEDDMAVPADRFDAANWKITLPVDSSGGTSGNAREVLQPALDTFELAPYFETKTDGVQYRAHVEGATTSGSEYPRSELREMSGSNLASWSIASGDHTLWVRCKVTHAPPEKPQVCVAQIHGGGDDVLQVLYDGTRNAITVRWRGTTHPTYLKSNAVLGTFFNVKIVVAAGRVKTYYNEDPNVDFTGAVKIHDFAATDSGCYFKAGCYTQSNETIDAPGAYGQVVIADNYPKIRHL